MTDIYEQASAIEELQRQHAIDRQRAESGGPDIRYLQCMDCGDPIPLERRQAVRNCRRCIDCANAEAARLKLFKR